VIFHLFAITFCAVALRDPKTPRAGVQFSCAVWPAVSARQQPCGNSGIVTLAGRGISTVMFRLLLDDKSFLDSEPLKTHTTLHVLRHEKM